MKSRRLFPIAVACALGAALPATPAAAAPGPDKPVTAKTDTTVTYDPEAKTGYVDQTRLRKLFGWSAATLAARASGVVFQHEFSSQDKYSVRCGARTLHLVHHRDFGHYELLDTVVRHGRGGSAYEGKVEGFRIVGPHFGISGTSVPPAAGQPCPKSGTIDAVRRVSTTTGWTLTATSGDDRRELLHEETTTK